MISRRPSLKLIYFGSAVSVAFSAGRLVGILFSSYIYLKDLVQFYLMGHALRAGVDMYAPIPELAARFDPHLNQWLRVSAYPPVVAVIGLPLSYLPYFWSCIAWLAFELGCLTLAVYLIINHFGGKAAHTPVIVTICAFIGWRPVYMDLYLGQLMIPILLLLTLTWRALRAKKDIQAGLLLGIILAIKLYAWPIALFMLLKGRWRVPVVAGVVFVAANVFMAAWIGSGTVLDYYLRVGSQVAAEYQVDPFNFSAWSIGFRAFGKSGAVIAMLSVLCYSLLLALRAKDFDAACMVMLAASTVLQPISWIHYMITVLPAFCFVANRKDLSKTELLVALLLIVLILPGFYAVAQTYAAAATWPPFLFTLGLMWLIVPKPVKESSNNAELIAEVA